MAQIRLLIPLLALITPFLIWPLETLWPYPYLIEELVKLGVVLIIIREGSPLSQFKLLVLFALLFSFSEGIFYLMNFYLAASLQGLLLRLVMTSTLHLITILTIWGFASLSRWLIPLGLAAAVLIHYLYNHFARILSF